ncbi:Imm26 family immunity protein [Devriesea agamarum]|uniref:Imm26 family immunity protein n=1 Tax=Devriesea agamarum TaxID=472569 RepID=UPI00071D0B10|nr:Imm26 family immunity protein [Devriesea agamarum]
MKQRIRRRDLKVGMIFALPVGDGHFYTGQIVEFDLSKPYIVIFPVDLSQDEREVFPAFKRTDVCLATQTMDLLLCDGTWPIIGSAPVDPTDHLPVYKLGADSIGEGVTIEDYYRNKQCASSDAEADQLGINFRSTLSVAGVQNAATALAGFIEKTWYPNYDKLLPENIVLARDFFK